MRIRFRFFAIALFSFFMGFALEGCSQSSAIKKHQVSDNKIDRYALVNRHNVVVSSFDKYSSLSVGNGNFAITVDPTGLQTFPDIYYDGVPLGTQSQWGWHDFPNPHGYALNDVIEEFNVGGRKVPYVVSKHSTEREKGATNWLRQNSHRLDLGQFGWTLSNEEINENDILNPHQVLNLWEGRINSTFQLRNKNVSAETIANQGEDGFSVSASSEMFKSGYLGIKAKFAYGSSDQYKSEDWNSPDKHQTNIISSNDYGLLIKRTLDFTAYFIQINWEGKARVVFHQDNQLEIFPMNKDSVFTFNVIFTPDENGLNKSSYSDIKKKNAQVWKAFWEEGGAVDFSGSTDKRAFELERRVVLSQYLTRIQDAGIYPPQETGLVYNSWYGKFHLEMHFWHEAQYALWGKSDLLERSLPWYHRIADRGRKTAEMQGYEGIRWPKMVDTTGRESPSTIGTFLIWQQPHIIFMGELIYRNNPNEQFLDEYKDLVFGTADFMASYARFDSAANRFILGPALIPAQERYKPEETINPTFELSYWYWGLSIAQAWRTRLGLERDSKWDEVMDKLSRLPILDNVYLGTESAPDTYSNPTYTSDHPSMLMAYGILPLTKKIDTAVMNNTFNKVLSVWDWEGTWGWDYPVVAMTATRLGRPNDAVDALLMDVTKNTYLPNGHNYQGDALRIYLPGNGSLLFAVALMCAGWDGYEGPGNPGFPKDGKWNVKWEGLEVAP